MDVLSTTRRTSLGTGLVAIALLIAGCSLAVHLGLIDEEQGLAFSHRLHYEDEGLDCIECHMTYDSEEEPGMPVLAQCMLCHEEIDSEKPPGKQIATLFDGKSYRARRLSALSDEVVFSHPDHALDEELCGSCHEGIYESDRVDDRMAVTMDECSRCHARLSIPNECSTCHSEIGLDGPPSTHGQFWDRAHGLVFRSGSTATANRCDLCHKEQDCTACHLNEPPENHDNYWRLRGHGLTARMDRASCYTCHREDSCQACHSETQPQNHMGMWGSARNTHCLSCHVSSRDGGCFVCHTGTPSHASAAPQPPDHVPGMNCLQCHGISAPLPHVQKGEDCTICHQ
jgi:hypothetical protein